VQRSALLLRKNFPREFFPRSLPLFSGKRR
jgi:hypothetical protein